MAQEQLHDPFGEPRLVATLPPSRPALGYAGVAAFVALVVLLLVARSALG